LRHGVILTAEDAECAEEKDSSRRFAISLIGRVARVI